MGLKLLMIVSLAGFEALTAMMMKSIVLLIVTQCSSIEGDQTICCCNPEGHTLHNIIYLAPTCFIVITIRLHKY
jgi:hypothetical protein